MSDSTTTVDPSGMERIELADLLAEFEPFLLSALNEHEDWFVEGLPELLREAWPDVQASFAMAIRYLKDPPDAALLDTQLAHVGLAKRMLRPKIAGVKQALASFADAPRKAVLGSVLGWMNIILGSLKTLVPGIEAVKEIKEVFERAIDDKGLEAADDDSEDAGPAPESPPPRPRRKTGNIKI